jgi:hypothetical protein
LPRATRFSPLPGRLTGSPPRRPWLVLLIAGGNLRLRRTIKAMARYFVAVVASAMSSPDKPVTWLDGCFDLQV